MPASPPPHAWRCDLPWQPESPQRRKIATQIATAGTPGVPLGGIGAGAIARDLQGGFGRWTIKAGTLAHLDCPENGFALWTARTGARALRSAPADPRGWTFDPAGWQASLFPAMWHGYRAGGIGLVIEQLSPVAPDLMQADGSGDADLPAGVFRCHLTNHGTQPEDAAVMLSMVNFVGWFAGFNGPGVPGGVAGQWMRAEARPGLRAIVMGQDHAGALDEGQGQVCLAVAEAPGAEITTCPAFDFTREGAALWAMFARDGRVAAPGAAWTTGGGFSEFPAARPAAALSVRAHLAPGETCVIDFALAWDLPLIRFGQGRMHRRHYTARWGAAGNRAADLAAHALARADAWEGAIAAFHARMAEDLALPPQATGLAVNELYFLTDGLTVWTDEGHFGLIECPDYPLYNTLDLWVYAQASVARVFPALSRTVTRAYAAEVARGDDEVRFHLRSDARFARQRPGMLPHDLGAPNADPFLRPNDYVYQDSAAWKDLNAMFVLCAWRDIALAPAAEAAALAAEWHPATEAAMTALAAFDRDGDGMIENDGFPDQTFDNIPMRGISCYCGGLWLAALRAAAAIAQRAGAPVQAAHWQALSARAEPAFAAALWTGRYFRLDSDGAFSDAVFAEQMFGPAFARRLGLGDVVDPAQARSALAHVWAENFLRAGQGRGVLAVTSARHSSALYAPAGEEGLQWDEVLIGFNYSFAAQLRSYGMEAEASQLMQALADELGPRRGLHFRTPAAIVPDRPEFRAQMNLRPLGALALAEACGK